MSGRTDEAPLLSRARGMFAKGDLLNAIDALRAMDEPPAAEDRITRDYLIVLALARARATRQALQAFDATLAPSIESAPAAQARDIASLRARCLKDLAFEKIEGRREALLAAAAAYEAAYDRFGGYYPLINAATLHLLAGDIEEARALADKTLGELDTHGADGDAYWRLATRAEALLVRGALTFAEEAIVAAAGLGTAAASDLASTKKQLLAVCRFQHIDTAILASFRIPRPLRYCGHQNLWSAESGAGHRKSIERRLAGAIDRFLGERGIGYAYGSLASRAETIVAETVLERGLELNLVFPFRLEEFVRICIAPAGEEWVQRFESCLKRAHSVSYVLDNDFLDDASLFTQCGSHSMGLAELRARHVAVEPLQLAVWSGPTPNAGAGMQSEIAQWMHPGCESHVLTPNGEFAGAHSTAAPFQPDEDRIRIRCFLFADVSGFSRLREVQLVPFVEQFLGGLGEVIGRFETDLRETAGDGIYLVMRNPAQAAECALEMQRRVRKFDFAGTGLPPSLNLRIAIHHGPGQVVTDPILHLRKLVGREITRAARMEPITPLGEVYVTEQMACALALSTEADRFTCEYVGVVPSAKSFGSFRMYSLKSGGM